MKKVLSLTILLLFDSFCIGQDVLYFKSGNQYGLRNVKANSVVLQASYDGVAENIGYFNNQYYYMFRKGTTVYLISSEDYNKPVKTFSGIEISRGDTYNMQKGGKYYLVKRNNLTEIWSLSGNFILDARDASITINAKNNEATLHYKNENKPSTARLETLEKQNPVLRHDMAQDTKWGLWNNKTQNWVNNKRFPLRFCDISAYNEPYSFDDKKFYIVTDEDGWKTTVTADNLSFLGTIPKGQTIINGKTIQDIGIIVVKDDPYETWSLCDIYGNKIEGCKGWRKINFSENNREVAFQGYNYYSKQPVNIKMSYTKLANEARKSMRETEEKSLKERQLVSFKEYATAYIQPRISVWQKKGEFEKVEDYQRRVGGNNRQRKIDELSLEAKRLFIQENTEKYKLEQNLRLGDYDSENEVFAIRSPRYGLLLIPVPLANAPSFKDGFEKAKIKNEQFFVENNRVAVAQFDIKVGRNTYHYTNNNSLNYVQYKLNQNDLGLEDINIVSGSKSTSSKQPQVKIISPTTGSQYQEGTVSFCIDVVPGEGQTVKLYVSINGAPAEELFPTNQHGKGARIAKGRMYDLQLPTHPGKNVYLSFTARDDQNVESTPQNVQLTYVGQIVKPKLILFAVGVGDYTSGDLTKLRYAAKDARDFTKTIEQANLSDYTELVKHTYTDRQATRSNINRGLKDVLNEANQGDVVMYYFSGHGVQDGDLTYFMTIDASSENPSDEGVNFADLKNNMKKLTERQVKVVAFMDACHAGAMVGAKGAAPKLTELDVQDVIEFYSSTKGEESAEDEKLQNGVFTAGLINGLNGAAANADGYITVRTLSTYLSDYVRNHNSRQTPVFKGVDAGDITLFHKK